MKDQQHLSRRNMLGTMGALAGGLALPSTIAAQPKSLSNLPKKPEHSFSFCLNTSTIMGQNLGIVKEIETAAKAGYDAIEIWINSMQRYVDEGGKLSELKKRIDDLGIKVVDAIGFAQWIVDDNDTRMRALEQAKREMGMLAQLGCARIAAPPAGATTQPGLDLTKAAERFRALVELGVSMEVIPQLEVWGFSKNLSRLSEVLFVASECGHPQTRLLLDVYHLHKGGSDIDGLKLIKGEVMEIFHMNDYPAEPNREQIADKDRVHAGDGVAPLTEILKDLHKKEGTTILSLEVFNRDYWKQDPDEVAKTGLAKMKAAVATAFS
ncbi:MAG: sugar phosphate isomerase/epimerase family protein [Saprospiraceae bacterium]